MIVLIGTCGRRSWGLATKTPNQAQESGSRNAYPVGYPIDSPLMISRQKATSGLTNNTFAPKMFYNLQKCCQSWTNKNPPWLNIRANMSGESFFSRIKDVDYSKLGPPILLKRTSGWVWSGFRVWILETKPQESTLDFVGRITDLASKRHKSKWEESLIRRFYMEAFHAPLEDDISSDWMVWGWKI